MAVTVNSVTQSVAAESNQPHRQALISIDLDASYPTGGYAVSLVGVTNADGYAIALVEAQPRADYRFWWNPSTNKLMAYVVSSDSVSEVSAATNLSAVTALLLNCILK
ncbi:MAG: hypothetical protein GY838_12800 [bacterium]|nr:hypothetical protein [bacterium]